MAATTGPLTADNQPAEHLRKPLLGVLLVNLGSPDAPEPAAIRRYLKQFLSDPRVIELPKLFWQIILRLFILPLRPRKIAVNYRRIWMDGEDGGSPLTVYTRRLARGVQQQLGSALEGPVLVDWAMCYGNPSINEKLEALAQSGAERLLVLPLYPQYSGSTTGAAFDALAKALMDVRWVPELRMINAYHDDAGYIDALADSVRQHWAGAPRGDHLLMSFHGLPARYVTAGDPYVCHCYKTARLLAEALELDDDAWSLSFQSQFGKARWVDPKTTATLEALAANGKRAVDVICPGFAADCIETIDEIEVENAEAFHAAGGEALRYVPALNDRASHARALTTLIHRHCAGWPEAESTAAQAERACTAARATGVALLLDDPAAP